MAVSVYSYTIYHSPNAYLGTVLPRRAIAELPEVELVRRPIYVPRERGLMIAELLGGKENRNAGSYNREDCRRRLDVNEPATIVWAAGRAGLDPEVLMKELAGPGQAEGVRTALAEIERLQCPGVPTVVVDGQRFFGKDRVDWIADVCRAGG